MVAEVIKNVIKTMKSEPVLAETKLISNIIFLVNSLPEHNQSQTRPASNQQR